MKKGIPAEADSIHAPEGHAQFILAIGSTISGAVLGWIIQVLFGDLTKIEYWLVTISSILVVVACSTCFGFYKKTILATNELADKISALEESFINQLEHIGQATKQAVEIAEDLARHQAELVPRSEIYRVMAECIRGAMSEVVVITYMMADWESGRRNFAPDSVDTPHRGEFYDAIFSAIKDPKIQYIRVWQIPRGKESMANQFIDSNENHKKEKILIDEISRDHPEQARLILTTQLTTASFILIDRKHLFFNVDFYDPDRGIWYSPYMLFIKDASSRAFSQLQSLIIRLTVK